MNHCDIWLVDADSRGPEDGRTQTHRGDELERCNERMTESEAALREWLAG